MKIEQLLVQHFYNAREVTLQGMGTFTLSPDFVMPKDNDKDAEIPENAMSFQYDAKATADEALISFIVLQTHKMRALAAADLDSYLVLGKQFLNIGKPFKIDGIGLLVKTQQGTLEFTKGNTFHAKLENSPAALKEKTISPEISFASEVKPSETNNKKGMLIAGIVVAIGLIGTLAWYFLIRKNSNTVNDTASVVKSDTLKNNIQKTDTVALPPAKIIPAADGYTFKVAFLETIDSIAAVTRMNVLTKRGHKIIMYKRDSLKFVLAEPFTLPLADTAHIRDSLNNYYYLGKGFIDLK